MYAEKCNTKLEKHSDEYQLVCGTFIFIIFSTTVCRVCFLLHGIAIFKASLFFFFFQIEFLTAEEQSHLEAYKSVMEKKGRLKTDYPPLSVLGTSRGRQELFD